jgi:hypothetical protein
MNSMGHDRAFVVTSWPLIAEAEVESQAFVGFVGYNVAMWKALLQVFWFSLSVPFYHFYTHSSFIHSLNYPAILYHPRCIMFFSQHFSFPCQYHSTIAPYSFIHLPPTLYKVFLPVLPFPLSVSFHHC